MPLVKPDYLVLPGFEFDLSAEDETGSSALTPEEVRLRSETARTALEHRTDLAWMEEYEKLRAGGWDWRVAAYIAWASQPRNRRFPKNQDDFAIQFLGLTSDRAINTWKRKNPAIEEMIGVLQSSQVWDYRSEVFQALVANAIKPDYKTHNDRKLFLELTGDYIPTAKLNAMLAKGNLTKADLTDYSDAELAAMYRSLVDDVAAQKEKNDTDAG